MASTLDELPNINSLEEVSKKMDEVQQFRTFGRLWCPYCDRESRFEIIPVKVTINESYDGRPRAKSIQNGYDGRWENLSDKQNRFQGSLFIYKCTTCEKVGRGLVQEINGRFVLLNFFSKNSSVASRNCPESVRYYLEQAASCYSVKAYSATLAMFRTALDAVLYEAGYKDGMVGQKINKLESDIRETKAPKWATDLNIEFMKILKNLGNSSLHISKDDISAEKSITDSDIKQCELALSRLLYFVYEKDASEQDHLTALRNFSARKN